MKKMIAVFCMLAAVLWITQPLELDGKTKEVQQIEVVEIQPTAETIQEQPKEQEPEFIAYDDVPLSEDEQIHMQEICKELNVSYEFCLAIMESESTFKADAVGDGGESIGYFQINQANWKRMDEDYGLDVTDSMDNIECGVRMIWELFEKYGDDPYLVIMCYKCGERRGQDLYRQGIYITHQIDCVELCERAAELERSHGK